MAKTTKTQVDRARGRAQKAEYAEKIRLLEAKKVKETNPAKKAKIQADIVEMRFLKDKIRIRKNGKKKKKGLF